MDSENLKNTLDISAKNPPFLGVILYCVILIVCIYFIQEEVKNLSNISKGSVVYVIRHISGNDFFWGAILSIFCIVVFGFLYLLVEKENNIIAYFVNKNPIKSWVLTIFPIILLIIMGFYISSPDQTIVSADQTLERTSATPTPTPTPTPTAQSVGGAVVSPPETKHNTVKPTAVRPLPSALVVAPTRNSGYTTSFEGYWIIIGHLSDGEMRIINVFGESYINMPVKIKYNLNESKKLIGRMIIINQLDVEQFHCSAEANPVLGGCEIETKIYSATIQDLQVSDVNRIIYARLSDVKLK